MAGVRRGGKDEIRGERRKKERRAREAREDRTPPSCAHFDSPPLIRPATQAKYKPL